MFFFDARLSCHWTRCGINLFIITPREYWWFGDGDDKHWKVFQWWHLCVVGRRQEKAPDGRHRRRPRGAGDFNMWRKTWYQTLQKSSRRNTEKNSNLEHDPNFSTLSTLSIWTVYSLHFKYFTFRLLNPYVSFHNFSKLQLWVATWVTFSKLMLYKMNFSSGTIF